MYSEKKIYGSGLLKDDSKGSFGDEKFISENEIYETGLLMITLGSHMSYPRVGYRNIQNGGGGGWQLLGRGWQKF